MRRDGENLHASMASRLLAAHALGSVRELSLPDQVRVYEAIAEAIPDCADRAERLVRLLNEYQSEQRELVAEVESRSGAFEPV